MLPNLLYIKGAVDYVEHVKEKRTRIFPYGWLFQIAGYIRVGVFIANEIESGLYLIKDVGLDLE